MVIDKNIIIKKYKAVIDGTLSYADADRWSWEMMQKCDERHLQFTPPEEEQMLWELIQYLYGIDTPSMEDRTKTARNNLDIRKFLSEKGIEI